MRLDGGAPVLVPVLAQVAADAGDDASRQLSMVIIALVVLAVVIAVATVVFWRLTRPEPPTSADAVRWVPESPAAPAAPDRAPGPAPALGDTGMPPSAR